jgi:hypothetical protein
VKEKEAQIAELEAHLDRAREKFGKLKSQLSEERETWKAKVSRMTANLRQSDAIPIGKKSATPVVQTTEEKEEEPQPKARPKPRPVSKRKADAEGSTSKSKGKEKAVEEENSDIQEVEGPPQPATKPKTIKPSESPEKPKRGRPKKAAESGIETESVTKEKKGKKAENNNDSDVEVVGNKNKGKGKALREVDDEVIQNVEKPKKRRRPRSVSASESEDTGPPAKKKPNNPAPSKAPSQPSISMQAPDGEIKKKRKIRILPNQPSAFAWNLAGTEVMSMYCNYCVITDSPFI